MTCADAQATWGMKLPQPQREVLRAYLDCANADGVSAPGVRRIAWMTDYSERQVQRITHALEDANVLEGTIRWGKATEYRFNLDKAQLKPALSDGSSGDTVMSPHEMSPLTPDVTTQNVTPDIQVSPPAPTGDITVSPPNASHTSAGGKDKSFKDLNTKAKEQVLKDKSGEGGDNADARAKVFDQYSALTRHGIDSRIVSQQLLADVEDFGQEWIDDAVSIAALNGVTNWNYVRKMLRTWKRDGREASRPASVKGKFSNGNGAHAPPTPVPAHQPSEGVAGLKRRQQQAEEAKQHGSS